MHIIYLYSSKQAGLINVCALIFSHMIQHWTEATKNNDQTSSNNN